LVKYTYKHYDVFILESLDVNMKNYVEHFICYVQHLQLNFWQKKCFVVNISCIVF